MSVPFKVPTYHPLPYKFYLKPLVVGMGVGVLMEFAMIKYGYLDTLVEAERNKAANTRSITNK